MAQWWSEPFGPNGGTAGSGIKNQLGRPKMPHYTVLVREAVQNSWDARIAENIRVRFSFTRLGENVASWQNRLSGALPAEEQQLLNSMHSDSWVLIVSDRGTSGLGGPLRSDEPVVDGISPDFVQFMRNIGEPRDTAFGGGTYGYGKSIFYRSSAASAILVNTRVKKTNGVLEQRLMGACITDPFSGAGGIRFTGRHWWGDYADGVVMPLLDQEAVDVSQELGIPIFENEDTGTDIVVLLPNLDLDDVDGDINKLASHLRSAIYWNLWPKMVKKSGILPIDFTVEVEGKALLMPKLSDIPLLSEFSLSLQNLDSRTSTEYSLRKMDKKIGSFVQTTPIAFLQTNLHFTQILSPSPDISEIISDSPFKAPIRHIARMRNPELVVDYFEGDQMTVQELGYVGVFKVCDDFDEVFANSEPPTHDSWESSLLTGGAKGVVRESVAFLNRQTAELVKRQTGARSKVIRGLGRLSSSLAAFVEVATVPESIPDSRNGRSKSKNPRREAKSVQILRESRVTVLNGQACNVMDIRVTPPLEGSVVLDCLAEVMLANGRVEGVKNAPIGATVPGNATWSSRTLGTSKTGNQASFQHEDSGDWTVWVPCLEAAGLRLRIKEVRC